MISPLQLINTGSVPNDGTGDSLKVGATKMNWNFLSISSSLYELSGSTEILSSSISSISSSNNLKLNKTDLVAGGGITIDSSSGQCIISSTSISFDFRDVYLFA